MQTLIFSYYKVKNINKLIIIKLKLKKNNPHKKFKKNKKLLSTKITKI